LEAHTEADTLNGWDGRKAGDAGQDLGSALGQGHAEADHLGGDTVADFGLLSWWGETGLTATRRD
jgi:hypothetical protein